MSHMPVGLKQQYTYIIGNVSMWSLPLLSHIVDWLKNETI